MQLDNKPTDNESEDDELFVHHRFIVDKGQAISRIDKFLNDKLSNTSRNRIQIAANQVNILVNGAVVKPNYKVKPYDEISIVMAYPPRETEVLPENIPLDIVYEDEHVLVLNKPSEMV